MMGFKFVIGLRPIFKLHRGLQDAKYSVPTLIGWTTVRLWGRAFGT